jgi:hypothetical protein
MGFFITINLIFYKSKCYGKIRPPLNNPEICGVGKGVGNRLK